MSSSGSPTELPKYHKHLISLQSCDPRTIIGDNPYTLRALSNILATATKDLTQREGHTGLASHHLSLAKGIPLYHN